MSTCSRVPTAASGVRREIVALALAGTCMVLLASPTDPALSTLPLHPMWVLAFVLGARYGVAGLWVAPALTLGLLTADMLAGGNGSAMIERLSRGTDLAALATAGLCAAVGTAHERRKALLEHRLFEAEARAFTAEVSVDELAKIAIALRERCDHSATSMVFLVDVALRLRTSDPEVASEAALELALARTGATTGFVQLLDRNGHLRTLTARRPEVLKDLTATAAIERGVSVSADLVTGVRPEDSDLASPLLDEAGFVIGVIAVRGVPYSALAGAARADLAAVALWAARSLSHARRDAESETSTDREQLYAHA